MLRGWALAILLFATNQSTPAPMPDGPLDGVRIKLERHMCQGTCPDYSVEIDGDGTVRFTGNEYTLIRGSHRRRIPQSTVAALVKRFRDAGFWELRDRYAAEIWDLAEYKLTLTIGGKSKSVDDYVGRSVGMPASVTELEHAVDFAAGSARWVNGDETTLDSLRAEGWDFHSRDAADTLARAIDLSSDDLVIGLIDAGAPPDGRADSPLFGIQEASRSALATALIRKRAAIARRLLDAGAPIDIDAVAAAASANDTESLDRLLAAKPDLGMRDGWGNPLIFAVNEDADGKWREVLRLLLAAGVDVRAANRGGETALHRVSGGEFARKLIEAGADIEARDRRNDTPLFATFSEEVALVLLDAGARIDAVPNGEDRLRRLADRNGWKRVTSRLDAGISRPSRSGAPPPP